MIEFTAIIEEADRGGALVEVPDEVAEALGGGGRIKVLAEFDGVPYQGSVVTYSSRKVLGILRAIRDQLGKGPGDDVLVGLEGDDSEREVAIPPELEVAFDEVPGSREAFERLSFSHRRRHVEHILEAKQEDTRSRRALATVEAVMVP